MTVVVIERGSQMAQAGRKKKAGVPRTRSGRRSEAKDAYQENIEPILIRMRMFGLTEKDARDQKAATFIGRLCLTKVVSQHQYDAAILFAGIYERFQRAVKSPSALRSGEGGGDGPESEGYEDWCNAARQKWREVERIVQDCQNELHLHSVLWAALDYIVLRDEQMWHMVGDVRLALNALDHHFRSLKKGGGRGEHVLGTPDRAMTGAWSNSSSISTASGK